MPGHKDTVIIRAQAKALEDLFSDAEAALDPHQATPTSSFFAAFTVLLREGLEAILIVVVMQTLLRKAERHEVVSYVHGGWIAALGAASLPGYRRPTSSPSVGRTANSPRGSDR